MLMPDGRQACWSDHREMTMPTVHPVRALRAKLEATRLRAVEMMAAESAPSPDALRELATLQAALMAVRESIEEHSTRLGWVGDEEEIEEAARTRRDR